MKRQTKRDKDHIKRMMALRIAEYEAIHGTIETTNTEVRPNAKGTFIRRSRALQEYNDQKEEKDQ